MWEAAGCSWLIITPRTRARARGIKSDRFCHVRLSVVYDHPNRQISIFRRQWEFTINLIVNKLSKNNDKNTKHTRQNTNTGFSSLISSLVPGPSQWLFNSASACNIEKLEEPWPTPVSENRELFDHAYRPHPAPMFSLRMLEFVNSN